MAQKAVKRVLLLVLLAAALPLAGCAPAEVDVTPTVPPAEPMETPAVTPTSPPAPMVTTTPVALTISISPESGPPGTEVVATVTGFPAETEIEIGVGPQGEEQTIVNRPRTPSQGPLTTRVTIPETAEPGEAWVVAAETRDREARAVSSAFGVTAPPTPPETPTPAETWLLPDLAVLPSETVYIQLAEGRRYLRFETSFVNVGEAALHLVGERDHELQVVRAIQTVVTTTGEERSEEIGQFVFYPEHEHWHLESFARYELWSYPEVGEQELVASVEKVSFCMFDESPYDLTLPNAPQERQYAACDEEIQGLSVGWVDTYHPALEGQALDTTGLPDGRYQLRVAVNPAQHILESDYDGNETTTTIEISGNDVLILED